MNNNQNNVPEEVGISADFQLLTDEEKRLVIAFAERLIKERCTH